MFGLPGEMRLLRGQRVGRRLGGLGGFLSEHSGQSERADAIPGLGQASSMSWWSSDLGRCNKFIEFMRILARRSNPPSVCANGSSVLFHGIQLWPIRSGKRAQALVGSSPASRLKRAAK